MQAESWRERVTAHWADVEQQAKTVAAQLWELPELGLAEYHAAELLADWLTQEGFDVSLGVAGLPTGFVATQGTPGVRGGVLAEYDALPGLSNTAQPVRSPLAVGGAGHGCGHNLIAAANIAAAVAAGRLLRETSLPGQVVIFGTPGEEVLTGKLTMHQAGLFDAADVLFTSHADYQNAALSRPCMSVVSAEFVFTGQQGHTGWVVPGNALDAAELLVGMMERLRSHLLPGVSIEHVLRSPGPVAPNVVPEQMRVWCYLRHPDLERALAGYEQLTGLARSAAQSAGVAVTPIVLAATRGYLPNDELGRLLDHCLHIVGPPGWTAQDIQRLTDYAAALGASRDIRTDLDPMLTTGIDPYGQDDGEISWSTPLGRVNWAVPAGVPLHSWAATALFGTASAWPGAAMASQALTLAITHLLSSPETAARASAELTAHAAAAGRPPARAGEVAPTASAFWTSQ
jgi:aminobenzoyl-glutamate utilization protein B